MGEWKRNLFNYIGLIPLWLVACFCPCIVQGMSMLELNDHGGCGECLMGAACLCIGFSLNRSHIRNRYDIKGNCIGDCIAYSYCFHSCLVTQEFVHISLSKSESKNNLN
jgi:Cys-rich protein (TIGR01571 family)